MKIQWTWSPLVGRAILIDRTSNTAPRICPVACWNRAWTPASGKSFLIGEVSGITRSLDCCVSYAFLTEVVKTVHDTSGPTNGRLTKIFLCDLAGYSMEELVSPCILLSAVKITSRSSTWWGGQYHVIMTSQTAETFEFLPRVASRGKRDIQLAFDLISWRDSSMCSFQACKLQRTRRIPPLGDWCQRHGLGCELEHVNERA